MDRHIRPFIHREGYPQQGLHLQDSKSSVVRDSGYDHWGVDRQTSDTLHQRAAEGQGRLKPLQDGSEQSISLLHRKDLRHPLWGRDRSSTDGVQNTKVCRGHRFRYSGDSGQSSCELSFKYPKVELFVGQDSSAVNASGIRSLRASTKETGWLAIISLAIFFLLTGKALVYGDTVDVYALDIRTLTEIKTQVKE